MTITKIFNSLRLKSNLIFVFLFVINNLLFATRQSSDILEYFGKELNVYCGWGHPSPLQTYFIQNKLTYPFKKHSTGNYRGHIATWEIVDGKLFLKKISIYTNKEVCDNEGCWSEVMKDKNPAKYNVKSTNISYNKKNRIFADWFSGVLDCRNDIDDSSFTVDVHYLFLINNGIVMDSLKIIENEINIATEKDTIGNVNLLEIGYNYISFWYRLNENDNVILDKELCELDTWCNSRPIFDFYGTSILDFPYNWLNNKKSGAPHCVWEIKDNKFFLKELILYKECYFDSIICDTLKLENEFPKKSFDKEVFADWVNGVFVFCHGKYVPYLDSKKITTFKTEKYTFVRIISGVLVESYDFDYNFDFDNTKKLYSKQKQIIKDYFKPK